MHLFRWYVLGVKCNTKSGLDTPVILRIRQRAEGRGQKEKKA